MGHSRKKLLAAAFAASMLLAALPACDNKGKVEQAAEEIDEGIDTLKNGGKESAASKVDDAVDDVREGAKDAAEELRK